MEKKENKYLKQAQEELGYLNGDPAFRRLIEARAGFLRDQHAFEVAGIEKEKKETAKKLLKMGLTVEQIIEATDLTKEEIEKLKLNK